MKVYLTDMEDKDVLDALLILEKRSVCRTLIQQRVDELLVIQEGKNESKSASLPKVKRKHHSSVGSKGSRGNSKTGSVSKQNAVDNQNSNIVEGNQLGGANGVSSGIDGSMPDQSCGEQSIADGGVCSGRRLRAESGSSGDSDSSVRSVAISGEGRQDETCPTNGMGQQETAVEKS